MTIIQKYKKLNDIDHCLLRPGMWIGATTPQLKTTWQFNSDNRYERLTCNVNEGLLKIFDEIVSNSVDEHKRNGKVTEINVDVTDTKITIRDNGGIIVEKHPEYGLYVPELIFSELKAGSNFDDTEERLVAGTNGVGSTLTNIFSSEFTVKTSDGKLCFEQTFTNNMKSRSVPLVTTSATKKGYTEISFKPDLVRFNVPDLTSHMQLFRKRCTDIAAACNNLKVTFNGELIAFNSFKEYCELFVENVIYEEKKRWAVGFGVSNAGFQQISLVNAVDTKDGGSHIDYILTDVIDVLREFIKKKTKHDIKPSEIKNKLFVFARCEIVNPAFASQTKEKLITHPRDFGTTYSPSKEFLTKIVDSEIGIQLVEWVNAKLLEEEQRSLRDINKNLSKTKVLKLVDARERNRAICTLGLFEGDSAFSAFRKFRDPMTQGAFPLRGKFMNVSEHSIQKIAGNQEVKDLLSAIGLRIGEPPEKLRYGKILIYSDADPDGDSIAGLLINFFAKFWPDMIDRKQICRVETPLVVATQGKTSISFYTSAEFETWLTVNNPKQWTIEYKKGLASLIDEQYKDIIQKPRLFAVVRGNTGFEPLNIWFGSDVMKRKVKIMPPQPIQQLIALDPTDDVANIVKLNEE